MSSLSFDTNLIHEINLQPPTPTSQPPDLQNVNVNFSLTADCKNSDLIMNNINPKALLSRGSLAMQKKICRDKRQLKPLLMHLVRMGSFQSLHLRIPSARSPSVDGLESLNLNSFESVEELLQYCLKQCQITSSCIPLPSRKFLHISKSEENKKETSQLTVMQWNILSQAIGYNCDRFETCSEADLQWQSRKWKILYEIVQYLPLDIICLQEVDHFWFLESMLKPVGYEGKFIPKPDSPCYYLEGNTGPDGCAIFYNRSRFTLLSTSSRVIQVYDCPSNQVILICKFKCKFSDKVICVSSTHLKARKGPILSCLRDEQGKDILNQLQSECGSIPTILAGDFNADPSEPVYKTMRAKFSSAYCEALGEEPSFTNWTKREKEEETKQTLDYIFFTREHFKVQSVLDLQEGLRQPIPNSQYPSDHLSLIASFTMC
ncbi:nocturnin-like isoform X1 [Dinothrombium tinctorium]|uniref:Nocturnin n=1 Tax=Dinothrombium tinctorium TaxID=1965070 RepID=A0A443QEE4_9ACAR|nr:nocturnin-like isoform X1 [Dinothrombium tinctorium]RWS01389.1 nocturnin-like isoform X1 [Dinothrombium tinctorium]